MSIRASMLTIVKSGFEFGCALVAVGRFTSIPFILIIVRLTSIKEASKKNMMSIRGMISIRAFLIGTGELLRLPCILFYALVIFRAKRVQHQDQVVRRRLKLKLQFRQFRVEEVKENQRKDRDTQTAGGGDESLSDTTTDLGWGEVGVPYETERTHDASHRAQKAEQRGKRNGGVQDRHKPACSLNFYPGGNFERAFDGGVHVIQTVPDCPDDRVLRSASEAGGAVDITFFQSGVDLVQLVRVA